MTRSTVERVSRGALLAVLFFVGCGGSAAPAQSQSGDEEGRMGGHGSSGSSGGTSAGNGTAPTTTGPQSEGSGSVGGPERAHQEGPPPGGGPQGAGSSGGGSGSSGGGSSSSGSTGNGSAGAPHTVGAGASDPNADHAEAVSQGAAANECQSNRDCACGVDRHTQACGVGPASRIDATRQCPDFCTGIDGRMRTVCEAGRCRQTR